MKMSRFVALVAVGCMLCGGTLVSSVQAESKVAFVSIQSVLYGTEDGKLAKKIIKEKQEELKKKFDDSKLDLEVLGNEIEKKQSVWSPEVLSEKQREAGRMNLMLNKEAEAANRTINELNKKHLQPIINKLDGVLKAYGKDHGYTMIIDSDVASRSGMIVFGDPDLDITEDLVKLLEAAK